MSERRIRVLLCEHSGPHHAGLIQGFRTALEEAGYHASVTVAENIDTALQLLGSGEFEILVTDLSFGKDIAIGLDFVRKAKTLYPYIYIIACSSTSPTVEMVRNKRPSFDMFVPKRVILNPGEGELKGVGSEIHESLGRLVGVPVRIINKTIDDLRVSGEQISNSELSTLVLQVLGDLNATDVEFVPTEVLFSPVTGGYSGSLVGSVTLVSSTNLKYVKSIVKISLSKWAYDEAQNFKRYAKWMLPINKRVELAGEGRTNRFGAVAYAFVFGGEEEFFSLTKVIKERDGLELARSLETIFDREAVNFYNNSKTHSAVNIGQHYRGRYFPDERLDDSDRPFKDIIQRFFGARSDGLNWRIGNDLYPDPFRVLLSSTTKRFSLSICHGDLNSDNVICTSDGRIAYIDFQDTGPGHLLQDFAALESSIRLNWGIEGEKPSSTVATSLLKREWALAKGQIRPSTAQHYSLPCLGLRQVARTKFPNTEPWEYPYAIAALSLKLMRVRGFSEAQLCRLAACALVATREFESSKSSDG